MKEYLTRIFFLFCLIFFSCEKDPPTITPAIYHWQTEFNLESEEKDYLKIFPIKKIYLRFFDVDIKNGEPLPIAEIIWSDSIQPNVEIIPTIFITNRSLKNFPIEKIEKLGQNILNKIFENLDFGKIKKQDIPEIQIDCDWTETTREKYFRLLSFLKKNISKEKIKLSATIRLHQIKFYKKTGVPPVDKGMLMFYNVGKVDDWETENSILDLSIAEQYFENFENYPLQLDLALPVFSWGVLFRNGKMIKLISGLQEEELNDTTRFTKIEVDHQIDTISKEWKSEYFHIKKSTYLNGRYLYEDDKIRLENVSIETLEAASQMLKQKLSNQDLTISFYHLDTTMIKQFPYEKLQNICNIFYQ